jgi:hypothetical protein
MHKYGQDPEPTEQVFIFHGEHAHIGFSDIRLWLPDHQNRKNRTISTEIYFGFHSSEIDIYFSFRFFIWFKPKNWNSSSNPSAQPNDILTLACQVPPSTLSGSNALGGCNTHTPPNRRPPHLVLSPAPPNLAPTQAQRCRLPLANEIVGSHTATPPLLDERVAT